jgi:tetratricopeptide (TPR) repeat protein
MPSIRRSYSTSARPSSSSSNIKLTNYSITYNALNKGHTPTEMVDSRKAHDLAQAKGAQVLPKLLKYIEQYPHMPEFMNYLAMYYVNSGNETKSFEVTLQTVERFPNYLFGKTNLALLYLQQKEYEKVLTVIDESFDVKKASPERDLFHISEVRSMALLAIQYFDETEQLEKAETYLEYLKITLPRTEEIVGHLERIIAMARLRIKLTRLVNNNNT